MQYEIRTTGLTVVPPGLPIFDERATEIRIVDEAGGEFVSVRQSREDGAGEIRIDVDEWPTLREAIERMVGECRDEDEPITELRESRAI